MKFIISLGKKHLYLLAGIIGILAGIIIANAFGTSNPPVFGHTWGELAGFPAACPAGQVAHGIGPALACVTDADTRCDSSGVNCALDASDLNPGSVGTSEITDLSIATADIGNAQVTSTKVDASICKATGTNCRTPALEIKKIAGTSNACDRSIADKTTRTGNCETDCINSGFGECAYSQQPDCTMFGCSTTSAQHTCTCYKIV